MQPFALQTRKSTLAGREINAGHGGGRSIADAANNPGQGAAPIQLQRDDYISRWLRVFASVALVQAMSWLVLAAAVSPDYPLA